MTPLDPLGTGFAVIGIALTAAFAAYVLGLPPRVQSLVIAIPIVWGTFWMAHLIGTAGGILQGLSDNDDYRTNVGLVNVGPGDVGVTVEVWDATGLKLGEKFYVVSSGRTERIGRAPRTITGGDLTDGYIIIRPGANDAVYAWASYVDNRSTDQTFVRPLPVE